MKEIFSGNKELFKGLWIYDKIQWEEHPVIHIDFLGLKYGNKKELTDTIDFIIERNAKRYGVKLKESGYDKKFYELIEELSKRNKVVILIYEYDKPIIEHIENQNAAMVNRGVLKTFYEAVKGADQYLKFVFITGVSKFSKVSIFSGLNNLDDITIDDRFSTLLGYTHQELLHYFKDRVGELSVGKIKKWYNGYSWDGKNFVYNPLSILYLFNKNKFDNYWFSTGTPTFLTRLIRSEKKNIIQLDDLSVTSYAFDSYDIETMDIPPLLFQTGYLTLKKVEEISLTTRMYYFSYPNMEVKESFLKHLFTGFSLTVTDQVGGLVLRLSEKLNSDELEEFFEILKTLFASIPYDIFVKEREGLKANSNY